MEEIFSAIDAFGTIGVLGYILYKQDKDKSADENRHIAEIRYYRSLAFSLLTVVFISAIDSEDKIKAVIDSMRTPANEASKAQ